MSKKLKATPIIKSATITAADLLRRIRKEILAEPKRLNMRDWVLSYKGRWTSVYEKPAPDKMPACGTVACIAGWGAVLLGRPSSPHASYLMNELVGTGYNYYLGTRNTHGLFNPDYMAGKPGTVKYAQSAASRITQYIKDYPELEDRVIVVKSASIVKERV